MNLNNVYVTCTSNKEREAAYELFHKMTGKRKGGGYALPDNPDPQKHHVHVFIYNDRVDAGTNNSASLIGKKQFYFSEIHKLLLGDSLEVKLNQQYTALIEDGKVTVGDIVLSSEKVEELYNAWKSLN